MRTPRGHLADTNGEISDILASRDTVLDRYGSLFDPSNLHDLTAEEFKGFLPFGNNRLWKGIHRQQTSITSDMDRLRIPLSVALNQCNPIEARLNQAIGDAPGHAIKGLGPAVLTPILHVAYTDCYGVSTGSLRRQ